MAKDKAFEAMYKQIRLNRTYLRKQKRIDERNRKVWLYGRASEGVCPYCGEQMNWCGTCQMWSSSCCKEYGTCQCS